MSKIIFVGEPDIVYDGSFYQIGAHKVRIIFSDNIPDSKILLSGFNLVNEYNGRVQKECIDYTCLYRAYDDNPYQIELCNDNISWADKKATVRFKVEFGGSILGETNQEVKTYEELIIPQPIVEENYEFIKWSPEIPASGKIEKDITFTAIFSYVPTLEEYKAKRQEENKYALASFLKDNPLLWIDGMYYGVTQEDQNEMSLDLSIYQFKQSIGDTEWKLQWHSMKSACRDFTMEEFGALLNAIAEFVYPYRQLEMQYKESIYSATTKEEIDAVELIYELPVVEEKIETEENIGEATE